MKIDSSNLSTNFIKDVKQTYSHEIGKQSYLNQQPKKGLDKLEISNEAKSMLNKTNGIKDLTQIKLKIEKGFYSSDEVISKVASEILKEINK
jgi:anti-sigma28 factor (negative regulator of flagellin synthesis)